MARAYLSLEFPFWDSTGGFCLIATFLYKYLGKCSETGTSVAIHIIYVVCMYTHLSTYVSRHCSKISRNISVDAACLWNSRLTLVICCSLIITKARQRMTWCIAYSQRYLLWLCVGESLHASTVLIVIENYTAKTSVRTSKKHFLQIFLKNF